MVYYQNGFEQISSAANGSHEKVAIPQIEIPKGGFIYVFLTNESDSPNPVYFDDMEVVVEEHPVIQRDDYYPFGLSFNSWQREATSKENKFLYNDGAERVDDLDLNLDMTKYRVYNPTIGRWLQDDPLSETPEQYSKTPYQYSWNNPVRYNDKDGDCPVCLVPIVIDGLSLGASAVIGYFAHESLNPDRSKFKAQTREIFNEGSYLNNSSHNPRDPDFNTAKKIAKIGIAVGLVARVLKMYSENVNKHKIEEELENMSPSELDFYISNLRGILRSGENQISDQQYFGIMNPQLLMSAYVYDINSDIYGLERGLSEEQKAEEEKDSKKGRKAKQLLSNASDLSEGTYTWDGENWVIDED